MFSTVHAHTECIMDTNLNVRCTDSQAAPGQMESGVYAVHFRIAVSGVEETVMPAAVCVFK